MTPSYTLKKPIIYDWYYNEAPIKWDMMDADPPLANLFKASGQNLGSRIRGVDPMAVEWVGINRSKGYKSGLYHFLTPNGIAEQAALFLGQWNKVGGVEIAPIVDVEVDLNLYYPLKDKYGRVIGSTIGNQVWQDQVKTFLDLISAGTGRTPIIYTSRKYWAWVMTRKFLSLVPPTWTADYYLWVASYPFQPDNETQPLDMPSGWTTWAMWQYASKGRPEGYVANDLNVPSDWYALKLGAATPPPPPPPPPIPVVFPDEVGLTIDTVTKQYIPK